MSKRWEHKVVDIAATMFSNKLTERIQEELDRFGRQGWELVAISHTNPADCVRLYLKKEQ